MKNSFDSLGASRRGRAASAARAQRRVPRSAARVPARGRGSPVGLLLARLRALPDDSGASRADHGARRARARPRRPGGRGGPLGLEGGVRVSKIGRFCKNFGGVVLGCINTKFCKKICVWQHFSSSTRCAHFCTASISKF